MKAKLAQIVRDSGAPIRFANNEYLILLPNEPVMVIKETYPTGIMQVLTRLGVGYVNSVYLNVDRE